MIWISSSYCVSDCALARGAKTGPKRGPKRAKTGEGQNGDRLPFRTNPAHWRDQCVALATPFGGHERSAQDALERDREVPRSQRATRSRRQTDSLRQLRFDNAHLDSLPPPGSCPPSPPLPQIQNAG